MHKEVELPVLGALSKLEHPGCCCDCRHRRAAGSLDWEMLSYRPQVHQLAVLYCSLKKGQTLLTICLRSRATVRQARRSFLIGMSH